MRARALLAAVLAGVVAAVPSAAPAGAEDPKPTFSATTTGLPAPLANGTWEWDEGGSEATLRVQAAATPESATSFAAGWTSRLLRPPKDSAAFRFAYSINHLRVTTGNDVLVFEYRSRTERGRWGRWTAHKVNLAFEAVRSDGIGGEVAAAVGPRSPRVQWEWRLTGKLVGLDAVTLEVAVESLGT
jgi:hypothetical protein